MVTRRLTREQIPDLARIVVDLVEQFGFKWEFVYEYPVPEDPERRLQIRAEAHLAPASKVAELRAVMKRNGKLPPIVITEDGYIVDGNTRAEAARKNKYPNLQAIILDVKYEGARESETRRLWSLGAAFNARHGKGIDREELRRAVDQIGSDPNYSASRIAFLLGVTDGVVQGILAEKKAKDRAETLGLHVNGSLKAGKLRTLGRQSEYLNDEPFKELFSLAEDTGMSESEIREVVKKARETKSDEGALGVFAHERQARNAQISTYRASGKSVPPVSAKLRQRLGFILQHQDNPFELVENNPTMAQEHLDAIEKSIITLQGVVGAQRMRQDGNDNQ